MPRVTLSNPDKVLFPADGITKADLAAYYEAVAPAMVPHVRKRPLNLWRWNAGIERQRVVQQEIPKGAPEWVHRVNVPRRKDDGEVTHAMAEDCRWAMHPKTGVHFLSNCVDSRKRDGSSIYGIRSPLRNTGAKLMRSSGSFPLSSVEREGVAIHDSTRGRAQVRYELMCVRARCSIEVGSPAWRRP